MPSLFEPTVRPRQEVLLLTALFAPQESFCGQAWSGKLPTRPCLTYVPPHRCQRAAAPTCQTFLMFMHTGMVQKILKFRRNSHCNTHQRWHATRLPCNAHLRITPSLPPRRTEGRGQKRGGRVRRKCARMRARRPKRRSPASAQRLMFNYSTAHCGSVIY